MKTDHNEDWQRYESLVLRLFIAERAESKQCLPRFLKFSGTGVGMC